LLRFPFSKPLGGHLDVSLRRLLRPRLEGMQHENPIRQRRKINDPERSPASLILISRTPRHALGPTALIGFQSSGSNPFCTARSSTPARYRGPSGKSRMASRLSPRNEMGFMGDVSESIHRCKTIGAGADTRPREGRRMRAQRHAGAERRVPDSPYARTLFDLEWRPRPARQIWPLILVEEACISKGLTTLRHASKFDSRPWLTWFLLTHTWETVIEVRMSGPFLTTIRNTATSLPDSARLNRQKSNVGLIWRRLSYLNSFIFAEVVTHQLPYYRNRAFPVLGPKSSRFHLAFLIVGRRYNCSYDRFRVIDRYWEIDRRPVSRLSAHAPPYTSL
jgi:hypothetical protein